MTKGTQYGAYNARWLSPEEVAKSFVPLPAYARLVREGHSVLMGPRGCGKTTLLKMLTRRAISSWKSSGREDKFPDAFRTPEYEAVYIPSDARWSYEVRDVGDSLKLPIAVTEQTQRFLISASVINGAISTFESLVASIDGTAEERSAVEATICESLIHLWSIQNSIPSFADLGLQVENLVINLRGLLNIRDTQRLSDFLSSLPPVFFAHGVDLPIQCCKHVARLLPKSIRPKKWALCYDELEIAPYWLHEELLSGLRSVDQSFFLKLTWSPILPRASSAPDPTSDFTVIRLWNSHLNDPIQFCDQLTASFLQERFPDRSSSPDEFLGFSIFASQASREDQMEYSKDSPVYKAMKSLADKDPSFKSLLVSKNIDPTNPVPPQDPALRDKLMDQLFRKSKPVILLRDAFLRTPGHQRSRKNVALYSGKQAVYAASEGNPRYLMSLLNDLCDSVNFSTKRKLTIPPTVQAKALNAASRRFLALVKATPIPAAKTPDDSNNDVLYEFIRGIADIFAEELYGEKFPRDPIGSIKFDGKISPRMDSTIRRALEIGALVHVGTSPLDVPATVVGERFRLSFMICPAYKLALRNFREVTFRPYKRRTASIRKKVRSEINQMLLEFKQHENTSNS